MIRGKTVDEYISKTPDWAQEKLNAVRQIALDCGLNEAVKWGAPAYTHKTNILGLGAFKNWVSIWFHQGVFLVDDENKLLAAQGKTKGLRQWRFLPEQDIPQDLMKRYILEAIANDEKGLKIKPEKKITPVAVPEILEDALKAKMALWETFQKMSLSYQREYCDYVREAKRDETKQRRVQKSIDLISKGAGLNDKYKS